MEQNGNTTKEKSNLKLMCSWCVVNGDILETESVSLFL